MVNPRKRKYYRTNISTLGLIFIGGVEHEMQVQNLSISGLHATIEPSKNLHNKEDVLELMQESILVDIYIKKINLAGEAKIIRVDMHDGNIQLGLEFKQMSYDADNLLYKRKVYRKNMSESGKILIYKAAHDFVTHNVSIDGLMVRVARRVKIENGLTVEFKFNKLLLFGDATVIWHEYDEQGDTLLGLEYRNIKKGNTPTIPSFYHTDSE